MINCPYYEKIADEFSQELFMMVIDDEVFCELAVSEYSRWLHDVNYGDSETIELLEFIRGKNSTLLSNKNNTKCQPPNNLKILELWAKNLDKFDNMRKEVQGPEVIKEDLPAEEEAEPVEQKEPNREFMEELVKISIKSLPQETLDLLLNAENMIKYFT